MNTERFLQRVRALRNTWNEHREVHALTGSHNFDSQLQLLQVLHRWANDAIADVRSVYGTALQAVIVPASLPDHEAPQFTVILAPGFSVTLGLVERHRAGVQHWTISAVLTTGPGSPSASASPHRRSGQWTRGQLEDLILATIAAYERSLPG